MTRARVVARSAVPPPAPFTVADVLVALVVVGWLVVGVAVGEACRRRAAARRRAVAAAKRRVLPDGHPASEATPRPACLATPSETA
jgi:hypothetical protein